jgi:hypothetical protein
MFSPSAARLRMRKGMKMARNRYSSASIGTPMAAKATMAQIARRSCAMGKTWLSVV